MRIERVNETTIKFYLTYTDIEDRGFKQDELWTNRKRGEEFFWSMMEEVNEEEEFVVEGPLWIQVHASDKGIEFVVTKSKQDDFIHLPDDESMEHLEMQVTNLLSKAPEGQDDLTKMLATDYSSVQSNDLNILVKFKELEDVIQFSASNVLDDINIEDLLYMHEDNYYYFVQFDSRMPLDEIDNFIGHLYEFAERTSMSHELLEEYGKVVMSHNVRGQVRKYFK